MKRSDDVAAFREHLSASGLRAALRVLNSRTPHRYTGVYRYDSDMLRSVALVDRHDETVTNGPDVRLTDAYCDYFHDKMDALEFFDAASDGRYPPKRNNPVRAYCGVLIRDAEGKPFGTLCHYDLHPCQARTSDVPLLREAARMIYEHMVGQAVGS